MHCTFFWNDIIYLQVFLHWTQCVQFVIWDQLTPAYDSSYSYNYKKMEIVFIIFQLLYKVISI